MFITNDFHGTEYRTSKSGEEIRQIINTEPSDRTQTERAWITRVRKSLCGIIDCTCGGELSERGNQIWED